MGTPISELITDWALVEIDDERLNEMLEESPALLMRKMWLYVKNGIPYFQNPPEMRTLLKYEAPIFDSYEWIAVSSGSETHVETHKVGYEVVSVNKVWADGIGNAYSEPYYDAHYDSDTGIVTFPAGISDGTQFSMDFYKDGAFANDLGPDELRILGKCTALVWHERFSGNWLNMQPKINDKSFGTGSEANHTNAQTTRNKALLAALNDEIWRYAQNAEYLRLGNGRPLYGR